MALFPTNPSLNSTHDNDGRVWIFNGMAWDRLGDILIQQTVSITGPTYASTNYDYYIGVSYSGTAGIFLPPTPQTGRIMVVKDESGHAGDTNRYIVITGSTAGELIDNQQSSIININNGALDFIYRNGWRII